MLRAAALIALLASPALAETSSLSNGLYFGASFGFANGSTKDVNNPNADRKSLDDMRYGVNLGYNWSLGTGAFVGLEGEVRGGTLGSRWEGRKTNVFNAYYTEDEVKESFALKAKVGYASGAWAVYGLAGAVQAKTSNSLGCSRALVAQTNGCVIGFEDKKSSTASGYVLGVGAEYLLESGISMKMEYTHTDLGKNSVLLQDPNFPNSTVNQRQFKTQFGEVVFGVNYRF